MAAMADLQVAETDTVGLVGAMPASTDVRQGSGARVPAEYNRTRTFQMSFAVEGQALVAGKCMAKEHSVDGLNCGGRKGK